MKSPLDSSSSAQAGPSTTTRQKPNGVEDWFAGKDPDSLRFDRLTITNRPFPEPYEDFERGWRQPKFHPGPAYERALAKERMLGVPIGGRSKKAQLGSIEESWGTGVPKRVWLGEEDERKGMFELDEDPPSRNASPFREEEVGQEEIEAKKEEFLANARRGTKFEKMNSTLDFFEGGKMSVESRREFEDLVSKAGSQSDGKNSVSRRRRSTHEIDHESVHSLVKHDTEAYYRDGPRSGSFDQGRDGSKSRSKRMSFHAFEYNHQRSQNPHRRSQGEDPNHVDDDYPTNQTNRNNHYSSTTQDAFRPHSDNHGSPSRILTDPRPVHTLRRYPDPTPGNHESKYHQSQDYEIWLKRLRAGKGKRR
ncbi:hypothetical protein I302_100159 [Kwoniella bestiolae CBS 10118]|uniref:Uncharacterized protein n=1 Tax=Kwoniella bestiolae CBS 10118 TaxID=1296100 RepID=A0A1B9G4D9_9TREE|nr:hypothetical protein I302_03534 [Kwoniella bestiolae CBS 10118]OCF25860.1 hypothetical protein I302_03534 [Kwoniella bestiolae CBS 10118]